MAKETLGTRLRRLREEKGISRAEFAKRVGASPASVWNWESGTLPRGRALTAMASLLGTSEDFLTSGGNGSAPTGRRNQSEVSKDGSSSATVAKILADARAQIAEASGFPSNQVKLSLQFALD